MHRGDGKKENKWLEKILELALPNNSILIDTQDSLGYEEIQNYYKGDDIPLAILLTKILKNEKLTGCLVLENVCRNKDAVKTLEAVASVIQHIQSIFRIEEKL